MGYMDRKIVLGITAAVICSSACNNQECKMGTYGYDLAFLEKHNVKVVELKSDDGKSKVMVIPAWQGRVMTTTAGGNDGDSYGWINYKLIESGEVSPQFNPVGGEERFWLGPEGGAYSWYFKKGQEQVHANWVVPSVIDTEAYDIQSQDAKSVVFTKRFTLVNASDIRFDMGVKRTVSILDRAEISEVLGSEINERLNVISYCSDNVLSNEGAAAWTEKTGMPSIWMLGLFNPTPTTTVFIPYNKECKGKLVKDDYFGKIPSDRLVLEDGMLYFKIDGKCRTKLGLPPTSAVGYAASYDTEKSVLTILKYIGPEEDALYVNSQWGEQENPFDGDVINSYNDGPTEDGTIMGPFYEIEASSPAAKLAPGESLSHIQYTTHIQGDKELIAGLVKELFGVELEKIIGMFVK